MPLHMARCFGEVPVGTRVDDSMNEFIEAEAGELGISRAELMRRILDDYRDSRNGDLACPNCGQEIHLYPE